MSCILLNTNNTKLDKPTNSSSGSLTVYDMLHRPCWTRQTFRRSQAPSLVISKDSDVSLSQTLFILTSVPGYIFTFSYLSQRKQVFFKTDVFLTRGHQKKAYKALFVVVYFISIFVLTTVTRAWSECSQNKDQIILSFSV